MQRIDVFAFNGIEPAHVCSAVADIFGTRAHRDEESDEKKGERAWEILDLESETVGGQPTGYGPEYDQYWPDSDALVWGEDVQGYERGDKLRSVERDTLNAGPSRFFGTRSRFDEMGPSAFQDMSSAYGDMGPSAYEDLGFDEASLGTMGESSDYFGEVMRDGTDDIAEAEYQRRNAMAEQSRKANTDAALQQLEMRGQGAASDQLLAELTGAQGAASDLYQAGLDANAIGQARRDSAAGSRADIAERMGRNTLDAAGMRAQGLDAYGGQRAAGLDAFGTNRAAGLDTYGTNRAAGADAWNATSLGAQDEWNRANIDNWYDVDEWNANEEANTRASNWERGNSVSDTNTVLQNQVGTWNAGAGSRQFDRDLKVAAGQTNQLSADAGPAPSPFKDYVVPLTSAVSKVVSSVAEDEDED